MYLTRKWLEKFIDLSNIENQEITNALNSLGFEVESFKDYCQLNDKLKIAHVGHVSPIEGTHLNFCFVDKGEDLVSPIVCGASNVKEGQYVIVAEPGKTIANGLTLSTKQIQSKTSEGMICSLVEIGMDKNALTEEEQDWIYPIVTKEDTYNMIGNDVALEEIGFLDAVWEIDLTLNRSDALAGLQLVKEIANYFDLKYDGFEKNFSLKKNSLTSPVSLKINNSEKEVVKSAVMQMVKVKEVVSFEPKHYQIYSNQDVWLKFNNVKTTSNFWLDLSNAIALETGQPVIFLDPTKLDAELEIKNNKNKDQEIKLDLMCDGNIISTIGVDFNQDYLPNENSKEILVVYLALDPIFMRKQQKEFNCSTVALQRYMKPINPNLYKLAQNSVMYWLDQYNIYESNSDLEIVKQSNWVAQQINVELEYIQKLLGIKITFKEIKKLFKTLDFEVFENENKICFKIDENRVDIFNKADIVEEIGRIYGYNNILSVPPTLICEPKAKRMDLKLQKQSENYLIGLGFNNIKTYSLVSKNDNEAWNLFNIKNPINLMSPLSKERESYRLSLSKSIIETASFNSSKGNKNLKLYEFADIYNKDNLRERHLSVLITSDIYNQKAFNLNLKASYSYLKGICEEILKLYNLDFNNLNFLPSEFQSSYIHPFINAKITYNDKLLGYIYKLNPRFEQSQKLDATFVMELNIKELDSCKNLMIRAQDISKFQKTTRDVSFVLTSKVVYSDILRNVAKNVKYITKIDLLDMYQDETLKANESYSISLSFDFNSNEKQLTSQDVQEQWDILLANFAKLGIEIR